MSLAHFDEIYEVCCGMTEAEEVLIKAKFANERLDLMDLMPDGYRWWEDAIKEILNEKEGEVFHV